MLVHRILKQKKVIKNSGSNNLRKNFGGVFPLSKINHFIDFHGMILGKKKQNIRFSFQTPTDWKKQAHIGGEF